MTKTSTEKLIELLSDNQFYTQQKLANLIGISKARVWQILKAKNIVLTRPRAILQQSACKQCGVQFTNIRMKDVCRACSKVKLVCFVCKNQFKLNESDYKRRLARRKEHFKDQWFCSKKCYGSVFGKGNLEINAQKRIK